MYSVAYSGDNLTVTNTFVPPAPVVVDPPVRKEVKGDTKTKDKVTFMLRSVSNTAGVNPMPMPTAAGGKQSMTADVYGRGSIEFGEFELTKEGTYIYEITEVDGKLDGYKYDNSKYTVKYVVTKKRILSLHKLLLLETASL